MDTLQKNLSPPLQVFYSYAQEDERYRKQLENHLSLLQRQGVIASWHHRKIAAGTVRKQAIDMHLNAASIILLLISPDFLASDYCYSVEMTRALERHDCGEALVIPILLRPVDWETAPFARLQVLPRNAKPVVKWRHRDEAFQEIAQAIRDAIKEDPMPIQDAPLSRKKRRAMSLLPAFLHFRSISLLVFALLVVSTFLLHFSLGLGWECLTLHCGTHLLGKGTPSSSLGNSVNETQDNNMAMSFSALQSTFTVIPGDPAQSNLSNLSNEIAALPANGQKSMPLYHLLLELHNVRPRGFSIIVQEVDVGITQVLPLPQHPLNVWNNSSFEEATTTTNQYRVVYAGQSAGAILPAEYLRQNGFVYLNPGETDLIDIHLISRVEAYLKFSIRLTYHFANNSQPYILELPLLFKLMFANASDWRPYHLQNGQLVPNNA